MAVRRLGGGDAVSILDFLNPPETRLDDAPDLERTLWIRTLLDAGDDIGSDDLAGRMRESFFERGQYLFRQGDSSDRIYFILSGKVGLMRAGVELRAFGPQSVVGVVDTFLTRPRAFDGRAGEATTTLELDADDWFEFLEDNFALTCRIVRRVVANLPPTSPPRPALSRPSARHSRQRFTEWADSAPRASLGPPLDLTFVERLAVLRACPPLARARIQALARLAHFAEMVRIEAGQTRGLVAPALYVVETGRVLTTTRDRNGRTWQSEVRPGGAVGGIGLLDEARYESEVTGIEASTLFRIPSERLYDVMEDHFSVAASIFAYASEVLEAASLSEKGPEGPGA
jgi:CRP-like cAMP-binding protein